VKRQETRSFCGPNVAPPLRNCPRTARAAVATQSSRESRVRRPSSAGRMGSSYRRNVGRLNTFGVVAFQKVWV
jgi:hypothetical protein